MKHFSKYIAITIAVVLVCLFKFSAAVSAKDLFVAVSGGSDSTIWDNNDIDHPWATVNYAWYNAKAGDTVYFREGTHLVTSGIWTKYNGNNGTSENPITFKNYNNEEVTISCDVSGDTVFHIEKNYHYVEGITFTASGFNNGKAIFYIGEDTVATNFKATNCTFILSSVVGTSNTSLIRLQSSNSKDALIEDCLFIGPGRANGVIIFRSQGTVIKNCEFRNLGCGIFFKHSNTLEDTGIQFINNYFHNIGLGIQTVSNYALIENNLIVGGDILMGNDGGVGDGYVGADYNTIVHNTIYNGMIKMVYQTREEDPNKGCLHNVIKNNIIIEKCDWHLYNDFNADIQSDFNLYPSLSLSTIIAENGVGYSLATWQTHNGSDQNSLSASPIFVGDSNPTEIFDFRLKSVSPGFGAGSDGKDIGANISLVGVPSAGSVPNTPLVDCVEIVQEDFGPVVIFHDEFEDSTPMSDKYTEYDANDGDCVVVNSMGVGGSSKSVRSSWQAGQVSAGGFTYMFGRNPAGSESNSSTDFREIYWRFYMKTSKGWTGNPQKLSRATILASSNWSQAMIAHLWGEQNDLLLEIDPATGIDSSSDLITTFYNDFNNLTWLGKRQGGTPIYDTSMSNAWHCIEAHVRLNTIGNSDGIFEFWIDGNLEAGRDDLNWVGSWQDYGINTIMLENYWNGGAPRAQERFIDNMVISTERIGLSPSPVNPIIFKTAFEDPDPDASQSMFQAQVSSTPDSASIVWAGEVSGSANIIKVDIQSGYFQGTLSGKTSLDAGEYYVRVRHADYSGNYSIWSPWKPFRTSVTNPLSKPNSPKNLSVVQ